MPGIFGTTYKIKKSNVMPKENRIYEKLLKDDLFLELSSIKKFENDKGLFEDDSYILLIDGVILNLTELKNKYIVNDIFELSKKMFEKKESFFSDFRGVFCGFFKDKKNNKSLIFTNHFSEKIVYYYINNSDFIFSSELNCILDVFKSEKINYDIDESSIYCMLTYGYMYDNITPILNIKKLLPGTYIEISKGKIEIKKYYEINNKEISNLSKEDILKNIDKLFTNAVKLQYKKNREYGYEDYAPLSAGLDSRMTNYVLRKISKKDIYNITYSETGQNDFIVPSQISRELKNHWLFKNLDNGLALCDIEDSFKFTEGIIYYAWPSQLNDYLKLINTDRLGLIHTGVIGDVIIGTFFKNKNCKCYEIGDGAFSKSLINKLKERVNEIKYDNYEIGMFYNRACNGAVLGYSTTFQHYTECLSPFMNVDFVNYCLSIPFEYRFQHNIYYSWVNKYYPEATKYLHNGVKIPSDKSLKLKFKGKSYSINSIFSLFTSTISGKFNKKYGMNPFDYWYNENSNVKNAIKEYYDKNIGLVKNKQIKSDIINLYEKGSAIEKIQVISALSIYKNYIEDNDNEI